VRGPPGADNGFLRRRRGPSPRRRHEAASVPSTAIDKEQSMKWETPAAIDYRFGFEITLYIANR
jgi:pyrroloquinoline quinone biosynthesis protein A